MNTGCGETPRGDVRPRWGPGGWPAPSATESRRPRRLDHRSPAAISLIGASVLGLALAGWTSFGAAADEGPSPTEDSSSKEMDGPEETVSVESPAADPKIARRLREILTASDRFRRLEVDVRDGIVFLTGETATAQYSDWATEVARKTQDVVAVINDIAVTDPPIHWSRILSHLIHLGIAYLLALPIAWDRERVARSAGLRTFPLVSVASCGYMLIALFVLDGADAQARVMYGIITGIGFIGGGAILKDNQGVRGTATAASIWNTAAIGVAVAWKNFEIAIALSALNFITLRFVASLKSRLGAPDASSRRDSEV